MQIDRIDNNGNYEPSNCRFVSQRENLRNTSWNKLSVEKAKEIRTTYVKGKVRMKDLAALYGVTEKNIGDVINNKIWLE